MYTRSGGAQVLAVDFPARTITVIAVPYDEPATVPFEGAVWQETFAPGAFSGIDTDPERVRVNREHNRADAVGKCVALDPNDPRGLIATIRIARTQRGDDTLALADEGCLSASIGFGVHRNGQTLDRMSRTKRVNRAWLDHIALVQSPAYSGARVLAVRATPKLDAITSDPIWCWAQHRSDPIIGWARRRCRQ